IAKSQRPYDDRWPSRGCGPRKDCFEQGAGACVRGRHPRDQLSGLGAALQAMAKAGVTMKYHRIHKVLGEGNFVLVVSEGQFAGKPSSFYDLFRLRSGKIAEHWDIIESIPPRSE